MQGSDCRILGINIDSTEITKTIIPHSRKYVYTIRKELVQWSVIRFVSEWRSREFIIHINSTKNKQKSAEDSLNIWSSKIRQSNC